MADQSRYKVIGLICSRPRPQRPPPRLFFSHHPNSRKDSRADTSGEPASSRQVCQLCEEANRCEGRRSRINL
eukprot:96545-Hanusia_phi.AAC.1